MVEPEEGAIFQTNGNPSVEVAFETGAQEVFIVGMGGDQFRAEWSFEIVVGEYPGGEVIAQDPPGGGDATVTLDEMGEWRQLAGGDGSLTTTAFIKPGNVKCHVISDIKATDGQGHQKTATSQDTNNFTVQ